MGFITKKIVFIVSLIGTLFVCALFILGLENCYANDVCSQWRSALSNENFSVFLLSVPVLFVSLITLRVRQEVFHAWTIFLAFILPVGILATILTPDNASFMWSDPKLSLALFFSLMIGIGSIGLVLWKSRR